MERVPGDYELDFLSECTKEQLDPLVSILLKAATNYLDINPDYKRYRPDHTKYVSAIIADFQLFGGNSFANTIRGHGVRYREILEDVCDNQKVPYDKSAPTEIIEKVLLEKSLRSMWSKMSEEQREQILKELGAGSLNVAGTGASALLAIFRMGGFESYKVMVMLVNGLATAILGRGLAFGANAALTKTISIVTGPIGWAVGGAWTLLDIASPAMRVTVPGTVYIAALREIKRNEKIAKEISEKIKQKLEAEREKKIAEQKMRTFITWVSLAMLVVTIIVACLACK